MSVVHRTRLKTVLQEMKANGFPNLPLDYPGVAETCMLYQQASTEHRTELVATIITPKELCTSIWDDTTMTFRTCLNTLTRSVYMLPSGAVFADLCANTVVIARDDALYTLRLDELDEPDQQPTLLFTATCYITDFCASRHGVFLFGDYMQAKAWLLDVASKNVIRLDLDFACYYYFEWLDEPLETNSDQALDQDPHVVAHQTSDQAPHANSDPTLFADSHQTLNQLDANAHQLDDNSHQTPDQLDANSHHTLNHALHTNSGPTLYGDSLQPLDQAGLGNKLDSNLDEPPCKQVFAFFQVGTNKITLQETKTVRTFTRFKRSNHIA